MITGGLEERCEQNTVKSILLRPSVEDIIEIDKMGFVGLFRAIEF